MSFLLTFTALHPNQTTKANARPAPLSLSRIAQLRQDESPLLRKTDAAPQNKNVQRQRGIMEKGEGQERGGPARGSEHIPAHQRTEERDRKRQGEREGKGKPAERAKKRSEENGKNKNKKPHILEFFPSACAALCIIVRQS
ncbi:hypothetical protein K438DRAFT_1943194 [Mycena galopus ATCC 62051]|nr:hypothetical protein K438DRAFT_1943194 [Mycena galopus ATCC 62051]